MCFGSSQPKAPPPAPVLPPPIAPQAPAPARVAAVVGRARLSGAVVYTSGQGLVQLWRWLDSTLSAFW